MKKNKLILIFLIFSLFMVMISSASAANYYVNNETTHKDINDWINKTAKNNDNLIFNTNVYDLNDTIIISKSINVMSYKNTELNFYKYKDMFYVKNNVNFIGLNLNHHGETKDINGGSKAVIKSTSPNYIKINIKNTNIKTASYNVLCIYMNKWIGSISNSNLETQAQYVYAIQTTNGKYNITNSKISTINTAIFSGQLENIIKNSTIISKNGSAIDCSNWKGKIIKSKIYANGEDQGKTATNIGVRFLAGLNFKLSRGIIENSIIRSKNAIAIKCNDDLKIIKTSLTSKKGFPKIYRYKPDLVISKVYPTEYQTPYIPKQAYLPKQGMYYVTIANAGYKSSQSCYLSFKTMKIHKKFFVKPLKPNQETTIKIKFNSKYMSEYMNIKYPKIFKVDYYNKIKEEHKYNNVYKIDKSTYVNV